MNREAAEAEEAEEAAPGLGAVREEGGSRVRIHPRNGSRGRGWCDPASMMYTGRGVPVEPMKPFSKAPGTMRLNLKYDGLLLNFPYKFNLRRYTPASNRS
jgi:hypothetical protein